MEHEVANFFPVPVVSMKLTQEENQKVKNFFFNSVRGKEYNGKYINDECQSLIHYREVFKEYKQLFWLKEKIKLFSNFVYKDVMNHITNLEVTDAWFNYAKKGSWQYVHNHCNSTLSGTLFIDVDDDFLIFHSPYEETTSTSNIMIDNPSQEKNRFGYTFHNKKIQTEISSGTILFWPSYLKHSYLPTKKDGRLTLSFNCLPTQFNSLYFTKTGLQENISTGTCTL